MKSIKTSPYLFVGIATVIAIVWIILPDVVSEKEQGCYQRLMGGWMSYRTFNRVQFYYFLVGIFILISFRRKLNTAQFILIEALISIPVLIEFYVYLCSH